MGLQMVEKVLR